MAPRIAHRSKTTLQMPVRLRGISATAAGHKIGNGGESGDQASAAPAAPVAAGHIGLGPSLVNEHQAPRVKSALMCLPPDPATGDVGAILPAGVQCFLNVIPSCLKKRHTAP